MRCSSAEPRSASLYSGRPPLQHISQLAARAVDRVTSIAGAAAILVAIRGHAGIQQNGLGEPQRAPRVCTPPDDY